MPFLWKGGIALKMQTIVSFMLLFLSKVLSVTSPLVLKLVIDNITAGEPAYWYIGLYVAIRFLTDFVTNLKDVTFANVSASSEAYIADHVFNHV